MIVTNEIINDAMVKLNSCRGGFIYKSRATRSYPSEIHGKLHVADNDMYDAVIRAIILMGEMKVVKTRSAMAGSYGLKHTLEDEWRHREPNHPRGGYMANGDVIVAAHIMGLKIIYDGDGPNCMIGVSRKTPRKWEH